MSGRRCDVRRQGGPGAPWGIYAGARLLAGGFDTRGEAQDTLAEWIDEGRREASEREDTPCLPAPWWETER